MRFNKNLNLLHGRIKFIRFAIVAIFLFTVYGFFQIQIINQVHYASLGEKYRLKTLPVKAERGLFLSRDGNLLVENQPTYSVVLHREELDRPWDQVKGSIAEFLNADVEKIDQNYRIHRGRYLGLPIPLVQGLRFSDVLRVKRQKEAFPFLEVEVSSQRYYRFPKAYSHILGYVGAVTPDQLEENPKLKPGTTVGRTGLERQYDELLLGVEGLKTVQIDSKGVFHHSQITNPPQPGAEIRLSLAEDLQQKAVEVMEGQSGIVLMQDVNSGEILVYYSAPTYDLNLFTGGISHKNWQMLRSSPDKPLFNRPIQGSYAPGSVFKLISALAGLQSGILTPSTRMTCQGVVNYLGRDFHCHKESGHGLLNLSDAIMHSCNVYFFQVAKEIDAQELAQVAHSLGLGKLTHIDLPAENAGVVPSPTWKREKYDKIWFPGETLSMAIGQGDLQITPIQMLRLMALVSRDGLAPEPHFLKEYKLNGKVYRPEVQHFQADGVSPSHLKLMRHAMWRTINDSAGTGSSALIPGFDVCGKTGTAQTVTFRTKDDRKEKRYQNAWFAGFAPFQRPEVAIVVLLEHAGHGGEAAAPIARQILEAYLESPVREQILDAI